MKKTIMRSFPKRAASLTTAMAACCIGLSCRCQAAESGSAEAVYFVAGASVYRLNLDDRKTSLVCSGLPKSEQLLFDPSGKLSIATWGSGSPILSFDTVKGGPFSIRCHGPGDGGQGLAYDAATSNLFLGLYYQGLYGLNEQNGKGWQQLVAPAALSPMIGQRGQLALDPANRHVYFRGAFNGDTPCRFVCRVNYDGAGLTRIVAANGGDALDIDPAKGHLYFSDIPGEGCLKRANLDGSAATTLLTLQPPYDICRFVLLDIPAAKLYLYLVSSNWRDRAIACANLDGSMLEILAQVPNVTDGWGIALAPRPPAPPAQPNPAAPAQPNPAADAAGTSGISPRTLAIASFIGAGFLLGVLVALALWAAKLMKAR